MSLLDAELRNSHSEEEVDSEGSWAISYGDMITLLLMFFILFFSTDKEKDRYKALEAALLTQLTPKEASSSSTGVADNFSVGKENGEGIDKTLVNEWGGEVTKLGSKILIEFPSVSFFAFGQVAVSKDAIKALAGFTKHYLPYSGNYFLTVRAFTDTVPVHANGSSRFKDNLELSALRAVGALRQLQKMGIPLHRMRAEGYGELKLSEEDKARGLAQTAAKGKRGIDVARRIVLIIEPDMKDKL